MLDWLHSAVSSYGYIALFLAMVAEGPIATVVAAFLASSGLLRIDAVFALAVAGDLTGDMLLYGLGRFGLVPGWRRLRRPDSPRQRQFARLKAHFEANAARFLVIGKLTHAAGFIVLLAAGAARVPMRLFVGCNLLATLPKAALFCALGFFAGSAYRRIDFYLWLVSCCVFVVIAGCAAVYLRRHAKLFPEEG